MKNTKFTKIVKILVHREDKYIELVGLKKAEEKELLEKMPFSIFDGIESTIKNLKGILKESGFSPRVKNIWI